MPFRRQAIRRQHSHRWAKPSVPAHLHPSTGNGQTNGSPSLSPSALPLSLVVKHPPASQHTTAGAETTATAPEELDGGPFAFGDIVIPDGWEPFVPMDATIAATTPSKSLSCYAMHLEFVLRKKQLWSLHYNKLHDG